MDRTIIGEALSASLFSAEVAIDRAMAETARLAAMLPQARADAMVSAVTGQRAFEGAAASLGALATARGHLVDTHNTLGALARRLKMDALAVGPVDKPGDGPGPGGIETENRVMRELSPT